MTRKVLTIKKYANRRLYDTTNSVYINQDEVAQMVREGRDLQIVDAATGEDLTRLVLTQIVVQHAKEPDSAFPLDILRQMVATYGKATEETAVKHMKSVLEMYQNAFRAMAVPAMTPFDFVPRPVLPQAGSAAGAARSPSEPRTGREEVDELKRRVAELESEVSKRRTRRSRRPKAASRRKS